jgi:hypothetical protein
MRIEVSGLLEGVKGDVLIEELEGGVERKEAVSLLLFRDPEFRRSSLANCAGLRRI